MKPAMKSLSRLSMALRIAGVAGLMLTGGAAYAGEAQACPATLQHTFDRLQDEKPQSLCQYSGKVVLVVTTATRGVVAVVPRRMTTPTSRLARRTKAPGG